MLSFMNEERLPSIIIVYIQHFLMAIENVQFEWVPVVYFFVAQGHKVVIVKNVESERKIH